MDIPATPGGTAAILCTEAKLHAADAMHQILKGPRLTIPSGVTGAAESALQNTRTRRRPLE